MPVEYYANPPFNYNGPCNCCGMLVNNNVKDNLYYYGGPLLYNKGITVLLTDELEESDDGYTAVNKVVTRQGVINTVIKYA